MTMRGYPVANENYPLVSVITPCLNMVKYLEQTIESVLSQDYPNLEYVVIDGGSTDGSLAILEKYKDRLRYLTGKDRGASDAIQRGFLLSHGTIFAYLPADDTYYPGAVRSAVAHLREFEDHAGIYGEGMWIDEQGKSLGLYPTLDYDAAELAKSCYVCQPASFVRRDVYATLGGLDTDLLYAFDYDFWLRLSKNHKLKRISVLFANSRMRLDNKTLGKRRQVFYENMQVVKNHTGYIPFQWIHGFSSYLVDGRDQFFEPLVPTFSKFFLSLFVGTVYNPRHPLRFWREWFSVMTLDGFQRRWNHTWLARRLSRKT